MESPLKPYEGAEPYVFVSYCHKDSEKIFAILQKLQSEGLRRKMLKSLLTRLRKKML